MTVYTRFYDAPNINRKEIIRYAGVKKPDDSVCALLDECLSEAEREISYSLCYSEYPIKISKNEIDFGFAKVFSTDLAKNLTGCDSAIVFAATIGHKFDRLLTKFSALSPSKAFLLQAIGAERIEALCNTFNEEISKENLTVPRFSAGYGDLPLEFQRDIFLALDCSRKIGLSLNQSLLMSPSKSVTAIIGIKENEK